MKKSLTKVSKFISLVLRHKPETIGLSLDKEGWADIDELVSKSVSANIHLTRSTLLEIVESNEKQRFKISEDGSKIRANQGHSIDVDLGLIPIKPPPVLYHGTATRFLPSIKKQGLIPGNRQHVHLSSDQKTAKIVGCRHGNDAVLTIDVLSMDENGLKFYQSENGVWLTDCVPTKYIKYPELIPNN